MSGALQPHAIRLGTAAPAPPTLPQMQLPVWGQQQQLHELPGRWAGTTAMPASASLLLPLHRLPSPPADDGCACGRDRCSSYCRQRE